MLNEEKIAELADEYGMVTRKVNVFYETFKDADCVINGSEEQELMCLERIISTIDSGKNYQTACKKATDNYVIADSLYDCYGEAASELIDEICPDYLANKEYYYANYSNSDNYSEESGNYNRTKAAKEAKKLKVIHWV